MDAQIVQSTPKTGPLRTALRANTVFSLLSGLVFTLDSAALANLTGIQPPLVFILVGLPLAVYGLLLWMLASQSELNPNLIRGVIIADAIWVAGSIVLLLSGWLPLTAAGKWLVALLADAVAVLAVLQYLGLRRAMAG